MKTTKENEIAGMKEEIQELRGTRAELLEALAYCHQFIDAKVKDNLGIHIAGQNGNIQNKQSIITKAEQAIKKAEG